MPDKNFPLPNSLPGLFDPEDLKDFFVSHLSRVYCAKLHLVERLPELADQVHLNDLHLAIKETCDDVQMQIHRMDEIFILLDAEFSIERCEGMVSMVEDSFTEIYLKTEKPVYRDLAILYYMSNLESMEMGSFELLKMAAVRLHNQQISQLLTESFDEAKADRALMHAITAKCIANL